MVFYTYSSVVILNVFGNVNTSTLLLVIVLFIGMSVKDKIAMWNSMGSNTTNPINTNNPPKVTTTTSNVAFKPVSQQQEPMRASENVNLKHQVEVPTIVRPSDAKKKAQMEQSQPINIAYKASDMPNKPSQPAYKQPEQIKK